jgi:hypothetical protein
VVIGISVVVGSLGVDVTTIRDRFFPAESSHAGKFWRRCEIISRQPPGRHQMLP